MQTTRKTICFLRIRPHRSVVPKAEPSKIRLDMELDGGKAIESFIVQTKGGASDAQTDINASN